MVEMKYQFTMFGVLVYSDSFFSGKERIFIRSRVKRIYFVAREWLNSKGFLSTSIRNPSKLLLPFTVDSKDLV